MMNGYTNPETYHFVLNVDNDETLLHVAREAVQRARANGADTTEQIGECLRDYVYDHLLDTEDVVPASHSMLHDVGSFWRVDADEIGCHYSDAFPPEVDTADRDAIDKLATLLGTSAEWDSDTLDEVARIVNTVRPNVGDAAGTYADDFKRATGRPVQARYDNTPSDDEAPAPWAAQ